ncbi:MAG: oligosaccharide flippase family protein [Bacteroidetes bacterium]|nr:oligosaccharide flippase family protein [Bacteroidota bacterium]
MKARSIIGGLRDLIPHGARDASVVFFGDVSSKFLTFLITLSMFALLTPDEYKLYGLFITVLAAINQFTDSGLHQSFIRFYALYKRSDPPRAQAHFQFAIKVKTVIVILTAIALYFSAETVAITLLRTPELVVPLRIMTLAILGGGMMEFVLAVLQARQEFTRFTFIRILEAAIKTGVIYAAILLSAFSLTLVYASYAIAPLIVAVVAVLFVFSLRDRVDYDWKDIGREVLGFGKWMMVTSFATMFLMRLDVFMISPMLADRPEEAGLYIAATKLCTPLIVLAGSVSTVFFPKAMELRSLEEMRRYVGRTFAVSLPVTGIGFIYLIAMYFVTPAFFPKYTESMPLFAVLFIGYAWTIIGNPLTMLMLSIGRERVGTWVALGQLVLTVASHYWFITHMGSMGAAISSVLVWFAAGSISMLYIYLHRKEIEVIAARNAVQT